MSLEILPFTLHDLPEALDLWRNSEGIGLFGETPEFVAGCLARNPGLSFVAREGTVLVGAVLCTSDGRRGFLNHLAVASSHRRRGIGSRLAEACVAELERLGIPRCHLFAQRGNDAAQAFWAGSGWAERADIVMMSRNLVRQS